MALVVYFVVVLHKNAEVAKIKKIGIYYTMYTVRRQFCGNLCLECVFFTKASYLVSVDTVQDNVN